MIRLYRWALRLLPRAFREQFGDSLLEEASASLAEASGRWARAGVCLMLLTDLLKTYVHEWADVLIPSASEKGKGKRMKRERTSWIDPIAQNLRFASRSFVKSPTFSWAAALMIALGVGAVTSVFAVVDQVLFRPLPYPDQNRLIYMTNGSHNGPTIKALDGIAAFDAWAAGYPVDTNVLRGIGEPTLVGSAVVTPSFFTLFGATPVMGRVLVDSDQANLSVAVLTHAAWETLSSSAPNVIGSTITVDSEPVTVVGVLSEDFMLPERMIGRDVQIFRPIDWAFPPHMATDSRYFRAVARLDPGVDVSVAQAQIDGMAIDLVQRSQIGFTNETPSWPLVPLREFTGQSARSQLLLLLAAVAPLLLIACANLALLFMTRGLVRSKEMSVRRALGARVRALAGQLVTESLVIGTVAGLLSVGLASLALKGFAYWVRDLPRAAAITLDLRVFAFALGLAVTTAMLFGLLPALIAARGDVSARLHQSGRSSTESRVLGWLRSGLVIGEAATSLVLVALTGLLLRSFLELTSQDPGVRAEQVWMIPVRPAGSENLADYSARLNPVAEALKAVPGVESVSYGSEMPFESLGMNACCHSSGVVRVEGSEEDIIEDGKSLPRHYITASYFETLGVGLVAGSVWDPTDVTADALPAVVSEQLATRAYGSAAAAVGRTLQYRGREFQTARIVGVAQPTLHYGLDGVHDVALYLPVEGLAANDAATFALRLSGSPDASFQTNVREAIWSVEPGMPVPRIEPLTAWIDDSLGARRLASDLATVFSAIALILAAAGLYGTLLYAVNQRRREMGIRLALGAGAGRIQSRIVLWGLSLGIAGVAIGVPAALYLGRFLRSWLWGISATDPMTLVGGSVVLLSAAAIASWLPAHRAARTDPLEVLRDE
jgi:putative ABC transport system permease protein